MDIQSATRTLQSCATLPQIVRLQEAMISALREAGEDVAPGNTDHLCPVTHHHAPGMYAREMFIPAGTVLVGKMHKHAHLCTLVKGRIAVAGEGGEVREMAAPMTFLSEPLVKRAGVALEDTIWITYHLAETTDLDALEAALIVPEAEVLEMAQKMEVLA